MAEATRVDVGEPPSVGASSGAFFAQRGGLWVPYEACIGRRGGRGGVPRQARVTLSVRGRQIRKIDPTLLRQSCMGAPWGITANGVNLFGRPESAVLNSRARHLAPRSQTGASAWDHPFWHSHQDVQPPFILKSSSSVYVQKFPRAVLRSRATSWGRSQGSRLSAGCSDVGVSMDLLLC